MQIGEHLNAAQIFLNLGENAQDRGILIPASMLFLQSATAYFLANELQQSIEQSYKGLNLLAANHRWAAFSREGQRIVEAWQHGGYSKEAQELLSWLEEKTNISSKKENEISADNQKYSSGVPSKCPYCGASLSLQQIKNTRQSATECKYCGSVVIKDQIE